MPVTAKPDRDRADAPIFVLEGFSWSAFYLGPIWCLLHRAWLALSIWTIAASVVLATTYFGQLASLGLLAIAGLLQLGFGLEAESLYKSALEKRGLRVADQVIGVNLDQAEQHFFKRHLQNSNNAAPASRSALPRSSRDAFGYPGMSLFPEVGS